jgi:predicted amino acid-binding ACT domain protein
VPKSTAQKLVEQELKVISRVNSNFNDLNRLFLKEVKKLGGLKKIQQDRALFRKLKDNLNRLYKRAGLDDVSKIVSRQLPDVEKIAANQLSKDISKNVTLDGLRQSRIDTLSGVIQQNRIIESDQRALFADKFTFEVFTDLSSNNQLSKLFKEFTSKSKAQLNTVVGTAVQVHDNLVTTRKANELGLTEFKYAGANDSRNRPFCAERVGNVYTDEEAEDWDNGQIPNADITLGGFNCRHRKQYKVNP